MVATVCAGILAAGRSSGRRGSSGSKLHEPSGGRRPGQRSVVAITGAAAASRCHRHGSRRVKAGRQRGHTAVEVRDGGGGAAAAPGALTAPTVGREDGGKTVRSQAVVAAATAIQAVCAVLSAASGGVLAEGPEAGGQEIFGRVLLCLDVVPPSVR